MRLRLIVVLLVCLIPYKLCADIRIDEQQYGLFPLRMRVAAIRDLLAEALLSFDAGAMPAHVKTVPAQASVLILPAFGRLSSFFGARFDPFFHVAAKHSGIDIAAAAGTPVRAAASGQVVAAGRMGGCGIGIVIDHGGDTRTRYCHLGRLLVKAGQRVQTGEVIGRVGSTGRSTGMHLHLEVLEQGAAVDPAERIYW